MLNKLLFKFFGLMDSVKAFLYQWGIKVLLFIFLCVILHNVLKMSELSTKYTGNYKSLIEVYENESKFMNVYQSGQGDKTIVILPDFGSPSPVIENKALLDSLNDYYRVVVVEYFGYGFSMSMSKHERINENFAYEIKTALENSKIDGPYVLLPLGTSNTYAMKFQQNYPELVSGIISIDGIYPEAIKNQEYQEYIREYVSNINITSIFELTGYERILSYISPNTFFINDLKNKYPNSYGTEEIAVYRNRIGSQYLSRTMVREANKLNKNLEEMKDYRYPENLPVLEILSAENINEYKNNELNMDLNDLAKSVITESNLQRVVSIENSNKKMPINDVDKLSENIKLFLQSY